MNSHTVSHTGPSTPISPAPNTAPDVQRVGSRGRISRRMHGVLDYVFAVLLIASPWIFGFSHQAVDTRIAVIFGAGMALYSCMTNYEMGLIRMVPFPMHLFLDALGGFALLFAWVHFATWGVPGIVFAAFGLLEMVVVFLTRNVRELKTGAVGL
jgi:hypothetical protein